MSFETSLLLGLMLVVVTVLALLVRKLLLSAVLLSCSSIVFGLLLVSYGAVYAGLFHIVTFAGALSVYFMVVLMIIGGAAQSERLDKRSYVGLTLALLTAIPLTLLLSKFQPFPIKFSEQVALAGMSIQPEGPLGFLWDLRAWDLLLVVIVVSAAMLGVMNLFSRGGAKGK